jgi:hypothetical protein
MYIPDWSSDAALRCCVRLPFERGRLAGEPAASSG